MGTTGIQLSILLHIKGVDGIEHVPSCSGAAPVVVEVAFAGRRLRTSRWKQASEGMRIDEQFLFTFSFPNSHEARSWLKSQRWGFQLLQQVEDGDGEEIRGSFVCVGSSHVRTESFLCNMSPSPRGSVESLSGTSPSRLEECGIRLARPKGWSWSRAEDDTSLGPQVMVASTATISPGQSPSIGKRQFAFDDEPVVDYPMGIWPKPAGEQQPREEEEASRECQTEAEVEMGCEEEIGVEYPMGWSTSDSPGWSTRATGGSLGDTTGQDGETLDADEKDERKAGARNHGWDQRESGIQTAWRDGEWLDPKTRLTPPIVEDKGDEQPAGDDQARSSTSDKSPLFTRHSSSPLAPPPLGPSLLRSSSLNPVPNPDPAPQRSSQLRGARCSESALNWEPRRR